jgi:hypothetical protein
MVGYSEEAARALSHEMGVLRTNNIVLECENIALQAIIARLEKEAEGMKQDPGPPAQEERGG